MSNHSIDLFLEACGAAGPLELSVASQSGQEPVQRALYQPFVLIGREPRSSLILNHAHVSRRHAYLQMINGRIFCMDLQSRTGTYWESGPKHSGWLDYGQALRIGPYWIRPLLNEPRNGSAAVNGSGHTARETDAAEVPQVTLEFLNQTSRASTWQMSPVLALVGKSPECRVHLVGDSVSSFHCSLLRTSLGLWVVDLLGRGGIWVNEMVVRFCRLDEGDRLQVGKFLMRVHYEGTPGGRRYQISKTASQPVLDAVSWGPPLDQAAAPEPDQSQPAAMLHLPPEIVLSASSQALPPAPTASSTETNPGLNHTLMVLPPLEMPATQGDASQALLVPIARQMGLMQQQMFDQFQQAMMMMFQMFNSLQRDQIGIIRQELNRLNELAHELQTLQAELAKRSTPSGEAAGAAARREVSPGPVPSAPARTPAAPARTAEPRPQPVGPGAVPAKTVPAAAPESPSRAAAGAAVQPGTAAAESPPGPEDDRFHAWIAGRIASIQEERQTRWQKVVEFLTGKK